MIADKREVFVNPALVCECITQWNSDSCRPHWSQHINPFVKQPNFGAQRAIIINESFFSLSQRSNFMRTIMMGVVISGGMQLASIKWVVSAIIFNVQCSPLQAFSIRLSCDLPIIIASMCVPYSIYDMDFFTRRRLIYLLNRQVCCCINFPKKKTDDNTRLMRSERSMP